jgi:hypothetical protein
MYFYKIAGSALRSAMSDGADMKAIAITSSAMGLLFVTLVTLDMATAQSSLEDRYFASRDASIKELKPFYDAGRMDDVETKAEDVARANLEAQLRAILGPLKFTGFGPGKLNLGSLYDGDEGYGSLDGLRFESKIGKDGEAAGGKDKDGNYVEPKAHIIVTTQTMFARWLRAHKDQWSKAAGKVPQQINAVLKNEDFYTQAFSTGSAVIRFSDLPITSPGSAMFAHAMLAARTQSDIPSAADEVYISALANRKVYIAYSSIKPAVSVPACDAARTGIDKKSGETKENSRKNRADEDASIDKTSEEGEAAFMLCFSQRAPEQAAFYEAKNQAQSLLEIAVLAGEPRRH